ncbi:hypothetical protein [Mesorhizobium sp. LSHC412B00]|uniref:hypothetical protein n=2 Tax=unclassified Mesorhizobium TaxID=325217 RepID=UPI0003CDE318|nr:hypothetical protein [Mesorhizobium sp. LSHC412B00]ESX90879.1 hypothetical protein X756_02330 [Mesorhizobium sp. LSHC412B00]
MPEFTIETTYHLPVFRQSTYSADTPEAACRLAIEDNDWSGQKEDYESSCESHVTGISEGAEAAYRGQAIPVPAHFEEEVQRKAQFELMLGMLKIIVGDAKARRPPPPGWLGKAEWAIARGEAIVKGARDPVEPVDAKDLP